MGYGLPVSCLRPRSRLETILWGHFFGQCDQPFEVCCDCLAIFFEVFVGADGENEFGAGVVGDDSERVEHFSSVGEGDYVVEDSVGVYWGEFGVN